LSGLTITSPLTFRLTLDDGQVIETVGDAAAYLGKLSEDRLDQHHWKVAVRMLDNALTQPTYLKTATLSLQTALLMDRVLIWPLTGVGPSGRTGSGYWIDHLPGVLLLKLDRTDIAES
jgi:hypothetical protein